ncbi:MULTISPECIES: NAD(P)/FAD-dependent oxidoreductase [unclassified Leifsonia]|uniref:NAD(P)/FAD-dependent oxidoreductase n=1 Tax=unclassified Leifsonia TaxID=2663824 RepID=UPI0006FE6A49|nr:MULTISPECIES: FAD-binding oxidoreductase [unclassified Leifsonia]KQX06518.1 FAD-dependent oxidoreductase [Leifsonia sp. Root1293]KRA10801.1 FAD-dependent oxidoreductase [Leifsonia sp. Root60]
MPTDHRQLSFWFDSLAESGTDTLVARPGLRRDARYDVCVVGGGLTGLWTAYYLAKSDPSLRIAVLEKHIAGFGASGRNGGWCSALFPRSAASLERAHGRDAAVAMRRAMVDTVDEVGRVAAAEGIDCDYVKGGTVALARDAVQDSAARAEVAEARRFGVDDLVHWDAAAVRARFGATAVAQPSGSRGPGAFGASFDPSCARVQPAKLVRGLAAVVEQLGVDIFENTEVDDWAAHRVRFTSSDAAGEQFEGTVIAPTVVIAVEGYGAGLPRVGRRVLPLYSLMIATEPLPDAVWDEIGIEHGQTFTDYRHLLVYGQRTADNRFAFGGRGARYHWGSRISPDYDRVDRVFTHLYDTLVDLFPQAADARVTHRWGGPLGVPRDWHATAAFNPRTGVAFAGGYVGDGLSTTNLAGRTLSDLIREESTDLTALPWVNHRSPLWEPEPLRFVGANLGLLGMEVADIEQRTTRRPSLAARLIAPLTGH